VFCFQIFYQNLPWGTDKTHKMSIPKCSVPCTPNFIANFLCCFCRNAHMKVYRTWSSILWRVLPMLRGSRDSSVGIKTVYGVDDREVGVRVQLGSEFSLLHIVQTGSRSHPAFYLMGTEVSFPGWKAAETWSWPASAEVKKIWTYISTPLYAFML
jgi:hypothetical protein